MHTRYRSETSMNHDGYTYLRVSIEAGIARVTLDNPPVNVLSFGLMTELSSVLAIVGKDTSVRVIVFDSAVPDFFIAHVDMTLGADPEIVKELMSRAPEGLNP